jgi:hypothetical protein
VNPVPATRSPRHSRERFSDTARRSLLRALLDGTLTPGERLHDDDLTAWLGISRTPIRSALDRLAELGLVDISANRSTRVASPTPETHRAALQVYGALHGAIAHSVLPALPEDDVDALCDEARRVAEIATDQTVAEPLARSTLTAEPLAGETLARQPLIWGREHLQAMGEITAFVSRRCANPLLLSVAAELDLRLAFSFVALRVPIDPRAVARCGELVVKAARGRDPHSFVVAMEEFLGSCAAPEVAGARVARTVGRGG